MEPVQVNSRQYVRNSWGRNIELGQQFNFSTSHAGIDAKFASDRDEVLLQNLHRYHASPRSPMFGHEFYGPALLRRRRLVVCIHEHVRIEKTTSAHESRFDQTANRANRLARRGV